MLFSKQRAVYGAMNDNIGVVNANRDLFVAPRPNLANADPGNVKDDFGVPR